MIQLQIIHNTWFYIAFYFLPLQPVINTIDNEKVIIEHAAVDSIYTGLRWRCDA